MHPANTLHTPTRPDYLGGSARAVRVGTKCRRTKPAMTLPQERAHFGKAIPPNFGDIDLKDFLP